MGHSKYSSSSKFSTRKLVEREDRWEASGPGCSSSKLGGELSKIVLSPAWCSKLRLTTGIKLTTCRPVFSGPRSDAVDQAE
ncbi:hypothetical protein TNCV_2214121 [Trichonephila clavipes]|nr:hypothetical protein TNCV_2214121 [Trichonephila clavipes]